MSDDRRLIEDYLPIEAISAEASREKSVRKGHISTLHLWWARRPLVACRAAVYGALVPASRFVPNGANDEKKKSLGRANAAKFVKRLCRYPSDNKPDEKADLERAIREARRHILEAHAQRLTIETASKVSVDDIESGRAARPKVLDMFAGGGAIPLEALRLGCEAHAVDLNPVAHVIELCTLVYPQKYGRADPAVRGMTGPKNTRGEMTWGGLAAEMRHWGTWVLNKVRADIGDLYPLIPDPDFKSKVTAIQADWLNEHAPDSAPAGYLMPVAYIWSRTVTCKNPNCGANVPLVKQTWLSKKQGRYVALKTHALPGKKSVRFETVRAPSESSLGFDPEEGSYRGTAVCRFCGTVADNSYVMQQGCAQRLGTQLMCVVATSTGKAGKIYLTTTDNPDLLEAAVPDAKLHHTWGSHDLNALDCEIPSDRRESFWCRRYGLTRFSLVFTDRQKHLLSTFTHWIGQVQSASDDPDRVRALKCYLALVLGKLSDYNSSLCHWDNSSQAVKATFARHALPMVWDFPEINPFSGVLADAKSIISAIANVIDTLAPTGFPAHVARSSATELPYPDGLFDAVVTDPPYYDNISYSKLSDYFYVWFRQALQSELPEHFASPSTPKKREAVVDFARANGDREVARREYETLMLASFRTAHRVLKSRGQLVCVYAHKTTIGWASLIESLRTAGFEIEEAWPLDTEMKTRIRAIDSASLASSIFLVTRKREGASVGKYEPEVQPELEQVVRERVGALWDAGISGADLVIACIGAGLRSFTRYARVQYANGEEVPAETFLTEVETVVLETILARLSKELGANSGKYSLAGLDAATRFYILWRYTYKDAELEAGEAIIFANGTHVELDGTDGISSGPRALLAKENSRYTLRDCFGRGDDEKLGLSTDGGQVAPLIDILHRVLWLLENQPYEIGKFLIEAGPNRDQLRLVVQALTGPALRGGELSDVSPTGELAVLAKLAANWRSVVDDAVTSAREREDRRVGQRDIFGRG
jgi:putative DNA methylase